MTDGQSECCAANGPFTNPANPPSSIEEFLWGRLLEEIRERERAQRRIDDIARCRKQDTDALRKKIDQLEEQLDQADAIVGVCEKRKEQALKQLASLKEKYDILRNRFVNS